MVQRDEMAVEVLTILGWYRGHITVPAGGRLLDFLNTKPLMIALTRAVGPSGTAMPSATGTASATLTPTASGTVSATATAAASARSRAGNGAAPDAGGRPWSGLPGRGRWP